MMEILNAQISNVTVQSGGFTELYDEIMRLIGSELELSDVPEVVKEELADGIVMMVREYLNKNKGSGKNGFVGFAQKR